MTFKRTGILLLCLLAPGWLKAAALEEKSAGQLYQGALEAYLSGHYEEAILMDSQALDINPNDPKAKALLDVLIKEKDQANRSEIWLRGEDPAIVPVPKPVIAPAAPIQPVVVHRGLDKGKLKELEDRIQMVSLLMERDSIDRTRELRNGQAQNDNRLNDITKTINRGFGWNYFLSLLAILLSSWALWNSHLVRKEQQRQLGLLNRMNPLDGLGNVVNLHK